MKQKFATVATDAAGIQRFKGAMGYHHWMGDIFVR